MHQSIQTKQFYWIRHFSLYPFCSVTIFEALYLNTSVISSLTSRNLDLVIYVLGNQWLMGNEKIVKYETLANNSRLTFAVECDPTLLVVFRVDNVCSSLTKRGKQLCFNDGIVTFLISTGCGWRVRPRDKNGNHLLWFRDHWLQPSHCRDCQLSCCVQVRPISM